MKPSIRNLLVFTAASVATAVAWMSAWPRVDPAERPSEAKRETEFQRQPWTHENTASILSAVEAADSDRKKLTAAADLLAIPITEMDDALDLVKWNDGNRLTLAGKVVLIRWASDDGQAAMAWARKQFKSKALWKQAFAEIGPAWAAHDPKGLAAWAMPPSRNQTPEDDPTDRPTIDSDGLTDIAGWLVTEDPTAAYQLLKRRGGFSSRDMTLPLALTSVTKVREALLCFGDLKITNPQRVEGDQIPLYLLLQRWNELDPDDFGNSPYAGSIAAGDSGSPLPSIERWKILPAPDRAEEATRIVSIVAPAARSLPILHIAREWAEVDSSACSRWLDSLPPENGAAANAARASAIAPYDLAATLDRIDQSPPEQWNQLIVASFDAWTKAHPGQRADRTAWPVARSQAWEDLEVLQSAGHE